MYTHTQHLLQVEVRGQFGEDVAGQFIHYLLLTLASAASLSRQGEQDAVKQLLSLLLVFGDVCVLAEPEDLRVGDKGKGTQVVNILLVVSVRGCTVQPTGGKSGDQGWGKYMVYITTLIHPAKSL